MTKPLNRATSPLPRAPRQWYYGWTILLTVSVTELISWGVLYYTFPVLLHPMQQSLGWSTTALTGAFSLGLLASAGAALPIGVWMDRAGARGVMTAGSCTAALLLTCWAAISNLALFYVLWLLLGVTMAATLYDPAFMLVATWFRAYRARALTILTVVAGFVSVIFVPFTQWLVQGFGWRTTLKLLALGVALTTIPLHALIVRRRPADLGLAPDGASPTLPHPATDALPSDHISATVAMHQPTFWWITTGFALSMFASSAMLVHFLPYVRGQGISPLVAASAFSLIGVLSLPGRLLVTVLGERMRRHVVIAVLFLLQTGAILIFLLRPTQDGMFGFVVLFGARFGAMTPARAALIAERFGDGAYAQIASIMGLFVTGARAVAPVTVGILVDRLGTYRPALWLVTLLSLVATGAILRSGSEGR